MTTVIYSKFTWSRTYEAVHQNSAENSVCVEAHFILKSYFKLIIINY